MPSTPELQRLNLPSVTTGQTDFVKQGNNIPAIASLLQQAADLDNSGFQQGVTAVDPSLTGNIAGVDELARLYGLGAVSDDTRSAIDRATAYSAISGGFRGPDADATGAYGAPGSSMQAASNAVRVGQTAQQEQQLAPQLTGEAMAASLALNPTHVDVGSTLISPAALQARQDAAAYYNNNLTNQAAILNSGSQAQSNTQSTNSLFSGLGGLLKGAGGISALFGGGG